jgi:hypothetical protein
LTVYPICSQLFLSTFAYIFVRSPFLRYNCLLHLSQDTCKSFPCLYPEQ